MDSNLIPAFIQNRIDQRKAKLYNLEVVDMSVEPNATRTIEGKANIFFLEGFPSFLVIKSENGNYGLGDGNTHEHFGKITITNTDTSAKYVRFTKVVFQD